MPYEKVGNNDPVCIADEVPFEIPENWEWVRLKNLVTYSIGKTPPRKEAEYWDNPQYSWVSIADMNADGYIEETKEKVSQIAFDKTFKGNLSPSGTLLMSFKLTVGKVSILTIPAFHNEAIISIYPIIDFEETTRDYLFFVMPLLSQLGETKTAIKGKTLNSDSLDALLIPLPSLAEQRRITEKIRELSPRLVSYDDKESALSKLEVTFPNQLKKSILQLAVQGKLVPQNPDDEPASVLLERIHVEKEHLIKEGKIKRDKHESVIYRRGNSHYEKLDGVERCIDEEIPFEIPESWEWVRLGNIFWHNTGKALNSSNRSGRLLKYITTSNLYWNLFELDTVKEMYFTDLEIEKCTVIKGDLLVCEGGDIGRAAIWNFDYNICIQNHIHRLRAYVPLCTEYYYYLFYLYKHAGWIDGKGIGIQGLSSNAIHALLFPLPPLAEQKRIVAKIDSMFPFLSKL